MTVNAGGIYKATILADAHALSYFDVKENDYVRVKKGIIKFYIGENGDPSKALLEGEIDADY